MTQVKQKVYLITEQQRNAIVNYLSEKPYKEVAIAIQILAQAPTTMVNIDVPEEQLQKMFPEGVPENLTAEESPDKDSSS